MNEIDRWNQESNNVLLSRAERNTKRVADQITTEARLVGLTIDAAAAIAQRSMERATDLDQLRHRLAGGDPVLNAALVEMEAAFITTAARKQAQFGGGFVL